MPSVNTYLSKKDYAKFKELCETNNCPDYQMAKKILEEKVNERGREQPVAGDINEHRPTPEKVREPAKKRTVTFNGKTYEL